MVPEPRPGEQYSFLEERDLEMLAADVGVAEDRFSVGVRGIVGVEGLQGESCERADVFGNLLGLIGTSPEANRCSRDENERCLLMSQMKCEAGQARHPQLSSLASRSCLKHKEGSECKQRGATSRAAGRRRMEWADSECENTGKDAYQLLGKKLVRFARRVDIFGVVPYGEIYGVHPRLFHFERDGTRVLAGRVLFDPFEVQSHGRHVFHPPPPPRTRR